MSILTVLHLVFTSGLLLFAFPHDQAPENDMFHHFSDYIQRFNKSYEFGTMEFKKRLSIFEQTLHRVHWLNKHRNSSLSAVYGINQYSDLTPEEFKDQGANILGLMDRHDIPLCPRKKFHLKKSKTTPKKPYPLKQLLGTKNINDLPKRVDWREKKVISPVNNQEQCGACWAFSSVETIETMYAMKTGELEQWSVQQVVDCAGPPNRGCGGGDTCLTVEWLYENKTQLVLAKDYPFTGVTGDCKKDMKSAKTVSIAKNFTCDSFVGEEYLMLLHIARHGPLIAAVDATGWQDYLGGIIQYNCDNERNHAVQIVGYDISGEIPYYIVRNSWGTQFGNDGYLNIIIGQNMCRIAEEVSAVDVI